jgi:D-inositol-3-phosphate glycosyltransferase
MRAIDERNTASASRLLANSRFTAANIAAIYRRRAEVSTFGVDSVRFRPRNGAAPGNTVLSVGAVRPDKGFDFVIEALALLPPHIRPRLNIVANADDTEERHYLTDLARRRGVELHLELGIDEDALVARYNEAALLVYAPVREPFGLASLEAMACEVPVVGVHEGGVGETIVHGVTGLLVERDAGQFGEAVRTLLGDETHRRKLGRQARQHAIERWSWEASVRVVEQHLAAVAGRENPGRCA